MLNVQKSLVVKVPAGKPIKIDFHELVYHIIRTPREHGTRCRCYQYFSFFAVLCNVMFVVVGCWFSCRAKMLDNEDHHHKKGVDIYDERGVLTLRSTEKAAK